MRRITHKVNKLRYFAVGLTAGATVLWALFSVGNAQGANRGSMPSAWAQASGSGDVRALYKRNCARCHGADGSADTESGRLYDTPDISGGVLRRHQSSKLIRTVRAGKGSMPSFGKKLTGPQIAALVEFMKTL